MMTSSANAPWVVSGVSGLFSLGPRRSRPLGRLGGLFLGLPCGLVRPGLPRGSAPPLLSSGGFGLLVLGPLALVLSLLAPAGASSLCSPSACCLALARLGLARRPRPPRLGLGDRRPRHRRPPASGVGRDQLVLDSPAPLGDPGAPCRPCHAGSRALPGARRRGRRSRAARSSASAAGRSARRRPRRTACGR